VKRLNPYRVQEQTLSEINYYFTRVKVVRLSPDVNRDLDK